jgi:hypothetical protein
MLFSHWFRRVNRPAATYRPEVGVLEDRIAPALLRHPVPPTPVPVVTHFQVIVPQNVEAGQPISVLVEAEDAHNHVVAGYKGTVQIKLGTADPGATLPTRFTFSAGDHGKHTIQLTLAAIGTQTVTATSAAITGKGAVTVAGSVTHFAVYPPTTVLAGAQAMVTVIALDANNHTVVGYTGTVQLDSTDYLAALPIEYTFQPTDNGSHLFFLTFYNAGVQTLTVSDPTTGSIQGAAQFLVRPTFYYPSYGVTYPYGDLGFSYAYGNVGYPYGNPFGSLGSANSFGTVVSTSPVGNIIYGANSFGNGASANFFGNFAPNSVGGNIGWAFGL